MDTSTGMCLLPLSSDRSWLHLQLVWQVGPRFQDHKPFWHSAFCVHSKVLPGGFDTEGGTKNTWWIVKIMVLSSDREPPGTLHHTLTRRDDRIVLRVDPAPQSVFSLPSVHAIRFYLHHVTSPNIYTSASHFPATSLPSKPAVSFCSLLYCHVCVCLCVPVSPFLLHFPTLTSPVPYLISLPPWTNCMFMMSNKEPCMLLSWLSSTRSDSEPVHSLQTAVTFCSNYWGCYWGRLKLLCEDALLHLLLWIQRTLDTSVHITDQTQEAWRQSRFYYC